MIGLFLYIGMFAMMNLLLNIKFKDRDFIYFILFFKGFLIDFFKGNIFNFLSFSKFCGVCFLVDIKYVFIK